MIRKLETLTEREKQMKKLYLGEGNDFLSRPMSFAEYKQLIREHPEYPDVGFVYEMGSMARLGTTVPEVEALTNGDAIDVEVHERYGYPVVHNHVYIEMIYVYSGTCTHYIESGAQEPGTHSGWKGFQMKAGDLCLLAPNVRHVITALEDDVIVLNVLLSKQLIDTGFLALLKDKYLLADFFKNILYERGASAYILFPTGADPWMKQTFGLIYQEEQKREDAIVEAFGRVIDAMNSKDDGPKRPGMGKSFTDLLRSIGELDPDDPERIRLEQMVKRLQELGIWFDLPGLDQEDGEEETLTQLLTEMRVKDFQAEI